MEYSRLQALAGLHCRWVEAPAQPDLWLRTECVMLSRESGKLERIKQRMSDYSA